LIGLLIIHLLVIGDIYTSDIPSHHPLAYGDGQSSAVPILIEEQQRIWSESDIYILMGQIKAESNWKETAKRKEPSGVVSYGLFQVTDRTFNELKKKHPTLLDYEPIEMLKARYSIRAGILYDLQMWKASPCPEPGRRHYYMMLRAYNGGLGWLKREIKKAGTCEEKEIEQNCIRSSFSCRVNIEYPYKVFKYAEHYKGAPVNISKHIHGGS
jgi:hypothetical protein